MAARRANVRELLEQLTASGGGSPPGWQSSSPGAVPSGGGGAGAAPAGDDQTTAEALESISRQLPFGAWSDVPPRGAVGVWREELVLVYCVGRGKFSRDVENRQYINLEMDMFDFHGRWVGFQEGVHLSETPLPDLFRTPPDPGGPYDQPVQVPTQPVREWTKGSWTFADGSAIYAKGPAQSHLVPFRDGSFLFMVTTGQVIAGGTGRYEDACGIKTATGTALVPPGLIQSGNFPKGGLEFPARTIECFRIGRRGEWSPVGPEPQGEGGGGKRDGGKRDGGDRQGRRRGAGGRFKPDGEKAKGRQAGGEKEEGGES